MVEPLEYLVEGAVHKVSFDRMSRGSPVVNIIPSNGIGNYWGRIIESRTGNQAIDHTANSIRDRLITSHQNIGAQVIRVSREPSGPYILIGSEKPLGEPAGFTHRVALSLFRSHTVYYAECVGRGSQGPPFMVCYSNEWTKHHGMLKNPYSDSRSNLQHENDMYLAGQIISKTQVGDRLVTRRSARPSNSDNIFLEPVINIYPEDALSSPLFEETCTLRKDNFIFCLPILGIKNLTGPSEIAGLGVIPSVMLLTAYITNPSTYFMV